MGGRDGLPFPSADMIAVSAFGVVIVAVYVVFTRRAYLGREERTERESLGTA